MPLVDIFFLGFALYLLYRFVFGFLVPVARTTKHVRQQFRNMQDTMQDPGSPFNQAYNQASGQPHARPQQPQQPQRPSRPESKGDYIDFEEIK